MLKPNQEVQAQYQSAAPATKTSLSAKQNVTTNMTPHLQNSHNTQNPQQNTQNQQQNSTHLQQPPSQINTPAPSGTTFGGLTPTSTMSHQTGNPMQSQSLEQPRRAPKLQGLQSREFSISFDETVQNFVGEMGPGQVVSRQTLASTSLGHLELQLKMNDDADLEVHIFKARRLSYRHGSKNLPRKYDFVVCEDQTVLNWRKCQFSTNFDLISCVLLFFLNL